MTACWVWSRPRLDFLFDELNHKKSQSEFIWFVSLDLTNRSTPPCVGAGTVTRVTGLWTWRRGPWPRVPRVSSPTPPRTPSCCRDIKWVLEPLQLNLPKLYLIARSVVSYISSISNGCTLNPIKYVQHLFISQMRHAIICSCLYFVLFSRTHYMRCIFNC